MNPGEEATLPFETEREARIAKNARLKELRSHASWLAFDPDAPFHDEIDFSAVFEENALGIR